LIRPLDGLRTPQITGPDDLADRYISILLTIAVTSVIFYLAEYVFRMMKDDRLVIAKEG